MSECRKFVYLSDVFRLIAGHSNYHGDSILSALTCVAEGKDVKPIIPISESYAHWIYPEDSNHVACICSHCGFEGLLYENDVGDMPYCPSCGFRMINIKDVSISS